MHREDIAAVAKWSRGRGISKAREARNLVVGLDIGTSKIVAVVAP